MIRTITSAFIINLLFFASCGTDTGNTGENPKTDSAVASAPAELKAINQEILASPNNPDLYHKRAKYYLANKSFDEGLADMSRAMNLDSTKAGYFLTLSDLYFSVNQSGNAKAALEKSIALDPKNVEAILKLAELYLYVNKSDKSIEYINQALKIDQYNAKAYFMKGMNYKDLKDTAKAISSMQTAVEQDQQYYNAYMQLGILCAGQKNKLAVDYYKNALRIQPKSVEAWYALGKFYQDAGDWNNAIGTYSTLLKFDNNKNVMYNLGVIHLVALKAYNKALEYFTGAINIDPKYVEAYYGRGVCYQEMKEPKKALAEFQTCLSINPDYEPAKRALQGSK
jgi:tetratricopeptide (TPR) repeat protein